MIGVVGINACWLVAFFAGAGAVWTETRTGTTICVLVIAAAAIGAMWFGNQIS